MKNDFVVRGFRSDKLDKGVDKNKLAAARFDAAFQVWLMWLCRVE